MRGATISPFAKPAYMMAKPVGSLCNLACSYCYYTEKSHLYPHSKNHIMSDDLLEEFIKQYIEMQTLPQVLFTWHGGEALMRPLSFYKKAVMLQHRYANGRRIDNAIQTNGTLLTEDWCRFFKDNGWLVGVSIDGSQEFHDEYRRSKSGSPSFRQVMNGIRLLNRFGVEWNALAVINDYNSDYPLDFYSFFKEIGCHYIQFTPIVERLSPHKNGCRLAAPFEKSPMELTEFSVQPAQWGEFLCTLFDEWVKNDVGKIFIQLFDATLANWMNMTPGICSMAETCGHAGVIEFNGDVYSCDHFVFPEYKLGNIRQQTLTEMMYSQRQMQFGQNKNKLLPSQCRNCDFLFACHGECPKNRFALTRDGEPGLNFLCEGYKRFYKHVAPYMDYMKHRLMHDEAPADVMEWIRQGMLPYDSD